MKRSPRIGIALGSGSARGWAHIGVLRALAREGIEPQIISGCSIGAFVGAVAAAGDLDKLGFWVETLGWQDVVGLMDMGLRGGLIKGDKLVVTQDAAGFQNGVATATGNKLATFRQKREATGEYVDGEAERIEYDSRNEKARLFNRARVTSGGDEVRGAYIEYDAISENYLATNAPGSKPAAGSDTRVRAVIQPKSEGKAVPQQ